MTDAPKGQKSVARQPHLRAIVERLAATNPREYARCRAEVLAEAAERKKAWERAWALTRSAHIKTYQHDYYEEVTKPKRAARRARLS